MLEIRNLRKSYGRNLAVDEVSFFVPDGPNGAGKSTIIKSIAGLLRYQGQIGIQEIPARQLEAKRIFGYVPEIPAMFEALTVREHIEYIRKAYASSITDEEVEALLERFELKEQQQRVAIGRALVYNPPVILLDEPMVGLDPRAIKELKETVRELRDQGVTVLISTHMLEMVEDLWDVMFVMEKGKIIGSYRKSEAGEKDLDDLFFEMTGGDEK